MTRHERDLYRTPDWVVQVMVAMIQRQGIKADAVIDLGCGDLRLGRACAAACGASSILGVDLVPHVSLACSRLCGVDIFEGDVLDEAMLEAIEEWRRWHGTVIVVQNPPFSAMLEFVAIAYELAARSVGGHSFNLLPRSFSDSKVRASWCEEHPLWKVVELFPRVSFVGGRTAHAQYDWRQWSPTEAAWDRGQGRLCWHTVHYERPVEPMSSVTLPSLVMDFDLVEASEVVTKNRVLVTFVARG